MPRVASEASIFPQIAPTQARFGGEPQRAALDAFAPLLLEVEPHAPPGGLPLSQPAAEGKVATPLEPPAQAKRPLANIPVGVDARENDSATAAMLTMSLSADPIAASLPAGPITASLPPESISESLPETNKSAQNPEAGSATSADTAPPIAAISAAHTTVPDAPASPAIAPVPAENQVAGKSTLVNPAVPAPPVMPGETVGLSTGAEENPVPIAEAQPRPQSKPPLAEVGNVQRTPPTSVPAVDKSAPQQAYVETAKAPPGEDAVEEPLPGAGAKRPPASAQPAKADKTVIKREHPASAAQSKRADLHFEPRLPGTTPVSADARTADIRTMPALDLGTAAIQSAPSSQNMVTPAVPAAPAASSAPVPMAVLAVTIATNAQSGRNRFDIRLDPPELGRIDVRLQFDASGNVTSHLIVDRSETLDLLRRDAADLERSLQQAGLKTSDSGLQFSLRDRSHGFDHENGPRGPATHLVTADSEPAIDPMVRGYLRAGQGAGLDIRV